MNTPSATIPTEIVEAGGILAVGAIGLVAIAAVVGGVRTVFKRALTGEK